MSTVTVVPTVELSNVPPRIRLDVTDVGTSPAITSTTVTRLDADGNSVPVRTFDGNPLTLTTSGSNRVGLLYDYEAPYGTAVSYSTLESPAVVSAQVTIAESRVWLVHPGVPAASLPITVAELLPRVHKAVQGVFYPMGRRTPVVVSDGQRKSATYSIRVFTATDEEAANFLDLLDDAGTLLLNVPGSNGWGVSAEYVAVGDVTESRVTRIAAEGARMWDVDCTAVAMPIGGSQSARTYVDVLAAFSSYSAVSAAYPSYAALLAGP